MPVKHPRRERCRRWPHIQARSSPKRSELERKLLATPITQQLSPLEALGREKGKLMVTAVEHGKRYLFSMSIQQKGLGAATAGGLM